MTEDADSRPENTPPSHEHATPGHSDRNHSSTGPRPAQGIRLTVTFAGRTFTATTSPDTAPSAIRAIADVIECEQKTALIAAFRATTNGDPE